MISNKPFNSFSDYLEKKYGCKVYKVAVDAGMTCPNRDGTKGIGGCTFCNNKGFSINSRLSEIDPVKDQVQRGIKFKKNRYKAKKLNLHHFFNRFVMNSLVGASFFHFIHNVNMDSPLV